LWFFEYFGVIAIVIQCSLTRLDLDIPNILTHIPQNSNVFTTNLAIGDCEGAIPIGFLIFHLTLNKVGQQTVFIATSMALSAQ